MKRIFLLILITSLSLSCSSALCPNTEPAAPWNGMKLTGKGGNVCRSDAKFITIEHSVGPKEAAFPYVEELSKQGWQISKTEGDRQFMKKGSEELEIYAYTCGDGALFGALPANHGCVKITKTQ